MILNLVCLLDKASLDPSNDSVSWLLCANIAGQLSLSAGELLDKVELTSPLKDLPIQRVNTYTFSRKFCLVEGAGAGVNNHYDGPEDPFGGGGSRSHGYVSPNRGHVITLSAKTTRASFYYRILTTHLPQLRPLP